LQFWAEQDIANGKELCKGTDRVITLIGTGIFYR
jgi:hypothetical protein